jgi:hypothetical protein
MTSRQPRARADQEVDELVRTLRSYGVLTREALRECSGSERWRDDTFRSVLERGIAEGRIKSLGAGLFEAGDPPPDLNSGRFDPP